MKGAEKGTGSGDATPKACRHAGSATTTERLEDLIRRQDWLEGPADRVQGLVGGVYRVLGAPGRALKDLLHGTTLLGHPLHPAVTDLPLGAWTVAVVADYVSHFYPGLPSRAGDLALLVGVVAGLGATATGFTDFHEIHGQERRFGLVHGLSMSLGMALMVASLILRWLGGLSGTPLVVGLATAGWAVAVAGSYLGGHLSFGFGTMVNHLAFARGPREFTDVGAAADFPEGGMRRAEAGGMAVLLVRLDGTLCAVADVCTHAGAPLHTGSLNGDVVTCPWHPSRFCVRDGRALSGPATFDQPTFEVREQDARVSVRLRRPLR